MNPHRESAPPCETCAEREAERRRFEPFGEGPWSARCPCCAAQAGNPRFTPCRLVPTGMLPGGLPINSKDPEDGVPLIVKRGFWFLRWWGRVVEICTLRLPHFHMKCGACKAEWIKATAEADAQPEVAS